MGLSNDNLEEALRTSTEDVCGLTDDGLYVEGGKLLCNEPAYLDRLFSRSPHLIALHSEDDKMINRNLIRYKKDFGEFIPPSYHSLIRDTEACIASTVRLLEQCKQYNNRLHVLHVSTGPESELFSTNANIREKRITAEACIHHLFFSTHDYEELGNLIKWNPSIKSLVDQQTLLHNIYAGKIDIIATDHAPHSLNEKIGTYSDVKPGGPMVQHALPVLLEIYHQHRISLQKIVEKTSHHVAELYRIKERGYIREGYYADLLLIDLDDQHHVSTDSLMYQCKWSPLLGYTFRSKISKVLVNGHVVLDNGKMDRTPRGKRLKFEKER